MFLSLDLQDPPGLLEKTELMAKMGPMELLGLMEKTVLWGLQDRLDLRDLKEFRD
jgi:hypothetical protein